MSNDAVEIKIKGLQQLLKAFSGDLPVLRIGILGGAGARGDGKVNNAQLGAIHEFGGLKVPMRSFLRMPLTEKLQEYMDSSGAFTPEVVAEIVRSGSIRAWMEKTGAVAERVIADAFATGGFGKWKPSKMTRKKNKQTLVETQQLRNSITSEVK